MEHEIPYMRNPLGFPKPIVKGMYLENGELKGKIQNLGLADFTIGPEADFSGMTDASNCF